MGFPGIFEALLLIALGFGYIVLYLAKREEKRLRFVGYLLGITIIVFAVIYMIGNTLIQTICYPKMRYYKGMTKQRMMQQPSPQAPVQKP